ncbi:MAG: TIGR03790 family protein [Thermoplasmata archaeon]|nr:MAG: TIGR03790 family protein [Thermoplasmata archaeon]
MAGRPKQISKKFLDKKISPMLILLGIVLMILLGGMQILNTVPPSIQGDEDVHFNEEQTEPPIPQSERTRRSTRSDPEYYDLINYDDVLVIRNLNSPMSMQIADYFQAKRNISNVNICNITAPTTETINRDTFNNTIKNPVEDYMVDNMLVNKINYIVTTKGVPLRISQNTHTWDRACVDSDLALILGVNQGFIGQPYWYNNPYFDPDPYEEFSAVKYQFFLVTRLTGYNFDDIKALIDKPELAIGRQGTFVFDVDPGKDDGGGYQVGNDWMREANATLTANGFDVFLDETNTFLTNQVNVSGYTSWGSNDGHYPTNSLLNSGLENDANVDDVPDNWYFVNETGIGTCERNDTEVRNGDWSVRIARNATSGGSTYFYQNYTVKPETRYYLAGYANLSNVSSGLGAHLQIRVYDSEGKIVQYYNGSARTGTTTSWVSLGQVHYEPLDGITNISVCVVLSKSNGTAFFDDIRLYEIKPHNDWIPGALAETYVSTGGRSFNYPTAYGQSLVADLIRDGVTGVKGYVYEPFLSACAHPNILFDAYTQGFGLAESYYMASEFLSWMDVVVGDPKLAPYDLDIVPDLSIVPLNITFSDDMPQTGEEIDIMVVIENLGPTSCSNVEIRFYVGDPESGGVYIDSRFMDIQSLGYNVTTVSWNTTGYIGDHNITIVIDPENVYYEATESNNIANRTITVHTGYPIADAGSDDSAIEDSPYIFDGSGSQDNSSIANYTWDFGDGFLGYGASPSHSFTTSGVHVVVLNVTNVFGLWDLDIVNITVSNIPPIADAGEDLSGFEGIDIEFNGSASTDTPSDIGSLNYTWYFGDGEIGYGIIATHAYDDNGTYVVTLEVRDDDWAVNSDTMNVTPENSPPIIEPQPPHVLMEDLLFTLDISASDVSGDTITFFDNSSMFVIDPGTGIISFTPENEDVGVHVINITAMDEDGGLSFIVLDLTVENTNDPPYIVSSPITEATEEILYQYDVIVEDDDFLVSSEEIFYSLDLAPSGMEINSTGSITWVPSDLQASLSFDVIVNVSDGEVYDLQAFTVDVTNINDGPIIISTPATSAEEDKYYTYDVNASDIDLGDVLSFSLDMAPQGMDIDEASGVISWTPTNQHVGNNQVIVNVTDIAGAFDTQEFTVSVSNINDPPLLVPINDQEATEDEPYYYQVGASDIDLNDELSFFDDSDLFSIDRDTGEISFTPTNDDVGTHIVNITVKDKAGAMASQFVTFEILNTNDPPVLDFVSDWQAIEDSKFTLTVTASDMDIGYSLTFFDNTTLFNIDAQTGEISFTPINDDVGVYVVNISVADELGGIDYQTVIFYVRNINDPPILNFIDDCQATQEVEFTKTVTASDVDYGDTLTFKDDTTLFDIDPNTGVISFTPTNSDVGVHTITISVEDEDGDSDEQTITFTIENVNDPPEIEIDDNLSEGFNLTVDKAFQYTIIATDVDYDDTLTFSDDTPLFDIDTITGEISFTPKKEDIGTYKVTITVTDSTGVEDKLLVEFKVVGEGEDGEDGGDGGDGDVGGEEDKELLEFPWILLLLVLVIVVILFLFLMLRKKGAKPAQQMAVTEEYQRPYPEATEIPEPVVYPPPPSPPSGS